MDSGSSEPEETLEKIAFKSLDEDVRVSIGCHIIERFGDGEVRAADTAKRVVYTYPGGGEPLVMYHIFVVGKENKVQGVLTVNARGVKMGWAPLLGEVNIETFDPSRPHAGYKR